MNYIKKLRGVQIIINTDIAYLNFKELIKMITVISSDISGIGKSKHIEIK